MVTGLKQTQTQNYRFYRLKSPVCPVYGLADKHIMFSCTFVRNFLVVTVPPPPTVEHSLIADNGLMTLKVTVNQYGRLF